MAQHRLVHASLASPLPNRNAFFIPGVGRALGGAAADRQQAAHQAGTDDRETERDRRTAGLGHEQRVGDPQRVEGAADPLGLGGIGVVGLLGVGGPAVAQRLDDDALVAPAPRAVRSASGSRTRRRTGRESSTRGRPVPMVVVRRISPGATSMSRTSALSEGPAARASRRRSIGSNLPPRTEARELLALALLPRPSYTASNILPGSTPSLSSRHSRFVSRLIPRRPDAREDLLAGPIRGELLGAEHLAERARPSPPASGWTGGSVPAGGPPSSTASTAPAGSWRTRTPGSPPRPTRAGMSGPPANGCSTTTTWSRTTSERSGRACRGATTASCPCWAAGPLAGYPRVYELAITLISHSEGRIDLRQRRAGSSAPSSRSPRSPSASCGRCRRCFGWA